MEPEIFVKKPFLLIEKELKRGLEGKAFWGDLDISTEEYAQLKTRIRNSIGQSEKKLWEFMGKYPVSFVTFLVFLVRYQFDVNFWGLLREELDVSIPAAKEADIGTLVRREFARQRFDISDASGDKRVNLGPILLEAGLPPDSCLDDLFYILKYDRQTAFDPQLLIDDLIEMRSYQVRKPIIHFLKRTRNDRAVEYIMNVREAILSVEQHMTSESEYVGRYLQWKENERTKGGIAARKKQEFQTKPYLWFENGSQGLCMVLPRIVLKDEWIEDVRWRISIDKTIVTEKNMTVFGDDGLRFVESISVPVGPAAHYLVEILDNEVLEDAVLEKWEVDGIQADEAVWFNPNGRMVRATSLPMPYGILLCGERAAIRNKKDVEITGQSYPTDRHGYSVSEVRPLGPGASLKILTKGVPNLLTVKPQLHMTFEGTTLFSLSGAEQPVFTEIPKLIVETDDEADATEIEVRIGKATCPIALIPENGRGVLLLKNVISNADIQYGVFSVRLYQRGHFLKQAEFFLVPSFETDYCPLLSWPQKKEQNRRVSFYVQRKEDWMLEFAGCMVRPDETRYQVECPPGVGEISVLLRSLNEDAPFSLTVRLPVNPVALTVTDGNGEPVRRVGEAVQRIGMSEWDDTARWLSAAFFGNYRGHAYFVKLRTVNGIEQTERLPLSNHHYANLNLSVFSDTLRTCPLPAQIELWCEADEDGAIPVLQIHDNVQMRSRPQYSPDGYIRLQGYYEETDFTIRRFGADTREQRLHDAEFRHGMTSICCGRLPGGLYVMETERTQSCFEFDEEEAAIPTHGNNTFLVRAGADGGTFSGWLEQLISDILDAGTNGRLNGGSFGELPQTEWLAVTSFSEADCEMLIELACFAVSPCSNEKKSDILACMELISEKVLTGELRSELIRCMEWIDCPEGVFELCLEKYQLLLFRGLGADSGRIAEKLDDRSPELAMLIRMRADEPMRSTIIREKYRELIGREALLSLLSVPDARDRQTVVEEQRRFLREETGSQVQVTLSKDISGDSEPLRQMIESRKNQIVFNTEKRPDVGIYFDHIRYTDQYINWYILSFHKDGDMKTEVSETMIRLVNDCGKSIMAGLREAKNDPVWGSMARAYDKALRARYEKDPLADMKIAIPHRYFFLLGIAALLAQMPGGERLPAWNTYDAERFLCGGLTISPRIGRRDILMAETYIYLSRKEKRLCR